MEVQIETQTGIKYKYVPILRRRLKYGKFEVRLSTNRNCQILFCEYSNKHYFYRLFICNGTLKYISRIVNIPIFAQLKFMNNSDSFILIYRNFIEIWNQHGQLRWKMHQKLIGHDHPIFSIDKNRNDNHLITGDIDGNICFWKLDIEWKLSQKIKIDKKVEMIKINEKEDTLLIYHTADFPKGQIVIYSLNKTDIWQRVQEISIIKGRLLEFINDSQFFCVVHTFSGNIQIQTFLFDPEGNKFLPKIKEFLFRRTKTKWHAIKNFFQQSVIVYSFKNYNNYGNLLQTFQFINVDEIQVGQKIKVEKTYIGNVNEILKDDGKLLFSKNKYLNMFSIYVKRIDYDI